MKFRAEVFHDIKGALRIAAEHPVCKPCRLHRVEGLGGWEAACSEIHIQRTHFCSSALTESLDLTTALEQQWFRFSVSFYQTTTDLPQKENLLIPLPLSQSLCRTHQSSPAPGHLERGRSNPGFAFQGELYPLCRGVSSDWDLDIAN